MAKLFSDGVYLGVTLTQDTFAQPAEPMRKAIARLMSARRRELTTNRRSFPKFTPGETTTKTYVMLYYTMNGLRGQTDYLIAPNRVAPALTGPEVEEATDA